MNPKPKVCFYAFNAYPAITGKNLGFVGGAELRQVLVGKDLAKRGYDVSFVVHDHGQRDGEMIDGVKIYKTVPADYSLASPMDYLHSIRAVCKALKSADSDVYFQYTAGRDMGFTALFCLVNRKKFVYGLVSDMDVDGTFEKRTNRIGRVLHAIGLKRANVILAQTSKQKGLLKERYGKDSTVIHNPYCVADTEEPTQKMPVVLWVGTIHPKWKRPELFLQLAREISEARFQMIGGSSAGEGAYYEKIKKEASEIPNLEFIGFVPYPSVNEYFKKASVFVNTSIVEGFPNTFLQAWSMFVPIVTLDIDPDEAICKNGIGFHSRTFQQMIKDVKILLKDENIRQSIAKKAREYAEKEHDTKKIIEQYVEVIEGLK